MLGCSFWAISSKEKCIKAFICLQKQKIANNYCFNTAHELKHGVPLRWILGLRFSIFILTICSNTSILQWLKSTLMTLHSTRQPCALLIKSFKKRGDTVSSINSKKVLVSQYFTRFWRKRIWNLWKKNG